MLLFTAGGCIRRRPRKQDMVLAIVGQKEIKESDFRAELERLDPSLRNKYRKDPTALSGKTTERQVVESRVDLLKEMIKGELLYQHALDRNVAESPEAKKRLARAEQNAAIEFLKELEIYSKVTVAEDEIKERYWKEVMRPGGSSLVKSVLYVSTPEPDEMQNLSDAIDRGMREGLSFPEIARGSSLAYESYEFDSAAFNDLDEGVRRLAIEMADRTGRAVSLGGTPFLFFRDAEPLFGRVIRDEKGERALRTLCYRRIQAVIRDEKGEQELQNWLRSLRASGTIRVNEKALDDVAKADAVAAEVNGVPLTVGDVTVLLEGLSAEQKRTKAAGKKELLDEAIDREVLRQEAWKRHLHENEIVKRNAARETRRILVNLVIERNVSGVTAAARERSLAELVAELKKAVVVKIVEDNVKKMYIPASKDIQDIFGSEAI